MKYVVILGDGMADLPLEQLDGKTPLAYAKTSVMDELAKASQIGRVQTVPTGMQPGSDTANLSVLGYDPRKYYTGRSPLEALSIGITLDEGDVAIRCNLVTVSSEEACYEEKVMMDHSADEISTEDAAVLLQAVKERLEEEGFQFYVGTSYRHCLVWRQGNLVELTPPHDILGQKIGSHLPKESVLAKMQRRSYEILSSHPLNQERKAKGLHPANSLWFWGAGTRPVLDSFYSKYGKKGVMISAVDLLKGIAVGAEMTNIHVEGANGGLNTNYEGKARAAVDALTKKGYDFAYIHVEAPDEMGHQGSVERKTEAIQYLDQRVILPVKEGLDAFGEPYRMLILPDHPTPVSVRTHTADPVPYLLYDSAGEEEHTWNYNEAEAKKSGVFFENGWELMEYFLR